MRRDDLQIGGDDPGAGYLAGQRSLLAIPLFDGGVALNMVIFLRRQPSAFNPEQLPDLVLMANLIRLVPGFETIGATTIASEAREICAAVLPSIELSRRSGHAS